MPDLKFQVNQVASLPYAASPTLAFSLNVSNATAGEAIHSVALRCQLQLEVTGRNYTAAEKAALQDLFGEPSRWSQTLRPLLWNHVTAVIQGFTGSTSVELQAPCTFDFNVAATKYFHGLEDGEVPVCFLFSGVVYYQGPDGSMQVSPIPWDKEARFRLPVRVWREMMDSYYPNSAWLCLRRDTFDRLYRYKVDRGIPTWEAVIDSILGETTQVTV
jgi:hypothetical protein